MAVIAVYELLPRYSGRHWGVSRPFLWAWAATTVMVLIVYPHHLMMDYAMPQWMLVMGQIISYTSGLPVFVVTVYGALTNIYRCGIRWSMPAMLLVLSMFGWAAGIVPAIIDGTISVNEIMHNTQWVPGHFHFYLLLGVLPMVLALMFHLIGGRAPRRASGGKLSFAVYVIGGMVFVAPVHRLGLPPILASTTAPAVHRHAAVKPPAHLPAPPAAPNPGAGAKFDLGVWTVHASSVDANFKTGDFSTKAKVVMTRQGGDVTADRANGNYKTQIVNLTGHVVMHDTQGDYGGLSASGSTSNGPSTLTADKAQIDGAAKIYKAIGNVHYVQGDTVVDSETGTLNDATHDLFLHGNVHIVQGTRKVNAQDVVYNTITAKAHAEGDVTMEFPGQLHRGLATPKPLKVPKNPLTKPATPTSATASPPA